MRKYLHVVGVVIFSIGVIFGMWLAGSTTAASLESYVYFGYYGYTDRPSADVLKCPDILTMEEIGKISLTIHNSADRAVEPIVDMQISDSKLLVRAFRERAQVPAGESRTLEWAVSADDVVYNRYIMAKVLQQRSFGNPARVGNCGIFVINLPRLTGNQVLIATITISVLCMLIGVAFFVRWPLPTRAFIRQPQYAMGAVTACVSLAMVFGIFGLWFLGIVACVVSVLLIAEAALSFIRHGPL